MKHSLPATFTQAVFDRHKAGRSLQCLALLVVLASSNGWCAGREPGGQGTLNSHSSAECFNTTSAIVTEVCGSYRINWKLWVLAGEPVGDYKLAWTLTKVKLKNPQNGAMSSFAPGQLPPGLRKAVKTIEMYVDAYAATDVALGGAFAATHRFDTGVAVRAGAGSSFNVPGSPNWGRLFIKSGAACDTKKAVYVTPEDAKLIFTNGVHLSYLKLCPTSGVSELTALESAVERLCAKPGAGKRFVFCSEQELKVDKEKAPRSLDDAFAARENAQSKNRASATSTIEDGFSQLENRQAEEQRRRAAAEKVEREQAERHNQLVKACEQLIGTQEQCMRDGCGPMPAETIKVGCGYSEGQRSDNPLMMRASWSGDQGGFRMYKTGSLVFPKCYPRPMPNPQYAEWQSCAQSMQSRCLRKTTARSVSECVSEKERSSGSR